MQSESVRQKCVHVKLRLELDKIKLHGMLPDIFALDVWSIVVEYVCEDPRIIDMVLKKERTVHRVPNVDRSYCGYITISHHLTATGLSLPIRFDHWYLPLNDGSSRYAYVSSGFGGLDALNVILMLPRISTNGCEVENPGDQFGIVLMRTLLYSHLHEVEYVKN